MYGKFFLWITQYSLGSNNDHKLYIELMANQARGKLHSLNCFALGYLAWTLNLVHTWVRSYSVDKVLFIILYMFAESSLAHWISKLDICPAGINNARRRDIIFLVGLFPEEKCKVSSRGPWGKALGKAWLLISNLKSLSRCLERRADPTIWRDDFVWFTF